MSNPDAVSFARQFIDEVELYSGSQVMSSHEGRRAYAFSPIENDLFKLAELEAVRQLQKVGMRQGQDYRIDIDTIGNLLVTVFGKDRSKTVMAGSHLDSVKNGGKHDGVDGVASALAYLRKFAPSKEKDTNFTFVVFRAEESSPMTGEACLGSKVMTGMVTEKRLAAITYGESATTRKLLSEHFGSKIWDEILAERSNPWVRKGTLYLPAGAGGGARDMEVIGYNELHIEQSNVLEMGGYQAGIVSHIGGSTNRRFHLDGSHIPSEQIDTSLQPHTIWEVSIHGKEAHTGGAPHNTMNTSRDSEKSLYRYDALVGSCEILRRLFNGSHGSLGINGLTVPKETGFTVVPAHQIIVLHAPHASDGAINERIRSIVDGVCAEQHLTFDIRSGVHSSNALLSLDTAAVLRHVNIPLVVERCAREISRRVESLFGGKVRGTVTDATINECGVRMNLNTRDIDPTERDELLGNIRRDLSGLRIDVDTLFAANVGVTEHIPLDPSMTILAERVAAGAGLRALKMPSMPSHDAACMQKAGVPTGMVFEAHDGDSHTPFESVTNEAQVDGMNLHHGILDQLTGRKR